MKPQTLRVRRIAACFLVLALLLLSLAPVTAQPYSFLSHLEPLDAPPLFSDMRPRSLALHAPTHPRIADGEAQVYHTWLTETVDSAATVGWYTSLALDTTGQPHISYLDYNDGAWPHGNLKYAHFDGTSWQVERVDHADPGTGGDWVAAYTSLALDANGRPHISYYNESEDWGLSELRYATFDGTTWITMTVDSGPYVGWWSSLKLDTADRPHISYAGSYYLKYAHFDGSAWITETVDGNGGMGSTSLALDAAGWPHISYCRSGPGSTENLSYAHFDGSAWLTETVASTDSVGVYNSLALDAANRPHISYMHWELNAADLRYTSFDGNAWLNETIDGTGWVGLYTSLALDAVGRPHIGYLDWGNGVLKYAHFSGTTWITETVDNAGLVGEYASLALDAEGRPHISYYDATNANLKYAWAVVETIPYQIFLPIECKPDYVPQE